MTWTSLIISGVLVLFAFTTSMFPMLDEIELVDNLVVFGGAKKATDLVAVNFMFFIFSTNANLFRHLKRFLYFQKY